MNRNDAPSSNIWGFGSPSAPFAPNPTQCATSDEQAREGNKAQWQRPQLVRMGHLKEFVQGGGKGGSQFDMDPQGAGKSGLG